MFYEILCKTELDQLCFYYLRTPLLTYILLEFEVKLSARILLGFSLKNTELYLTLR